MKTMNQILIPIALFALTSASPLPQQSSSIYREPGYSYLPPRKTPVKPKDETETVIDGIGRGPECGQVSVVCRRQQVGDGKYQFTCDGVQPNCITLTSEHILWLKSPQSESQQLDIVVPNYRVEELIRAGLKARAAGGQTNINILLKKPEQVYDVQAQDGKASTPEKPNVNLQYEAAGNPSSAHYPVDKPYNYLTAEIREPGAKYY